MNSTRYLITTEPRGVGVGHSFDDTPAAETLQSAVISRIVVWHTTCIIALEVHYASENSPAVKHGGSAGSITSFDLDATEYVTMVEGSCIQGRISHLTFVTNKRILGPVGERRMDLEGFVWRADDKVPCHLAHRMGLLAFSGTAHSHVFQLQATFANYPCETINTRYEGVSTPPPHTQIQVLSTVRNPALLSKFALHLMAPVVTLYVGPERTEFHAYEDKLCELAFFQACLHGQFKEAAEKTVNMPDDDADAVAALVEFLYTGSYTYTYDMGTQPLDENATGQTLHIPLGDLRQSLFQLTVYVTACKYGFQSLTDVALQNLRAVVRDIDAYAFLQVCEAMYQEGLEVSELGKGEDSDVFKKRLIKWVKILCAHYREEFERTTSRCPALACDLLEFTTNESED